MEENLIEKLDKSRYNIVKWLTVGWAAWFGSYILKDLVSSRLVGVEIFLVFIGLIGSVFFIVNLQKYIRLGSKIKHSRLNAALNNELHQLYKYKAFFWGFWSLLVTISIFYGLSLFFLIEAKLACSCSLYVGVLSSLIAGLVYNKG